MCMVGGERIDSSVKLPNEGDLEKEKMDGTCD